MTLKGPDQEDKRKIHAEINQITNHRFLVTTLAITIFGVLTAWLLPKSTLPAGQAIGGLVYVISTVQCLLLFTLFLLQVLLKNTLRLFTSYLVATDGSQWEQDWKMFRRNRTYAAYGTPLTMVFAILNLLSALMPFLLAWVYGLSIEPREGMWTLIAVGVITEALIIGFGFGGWLDREQKVDDQWTALKSQAR